MRILITLAAIAGCHRAPTIETSHALPPAPAPEAERVSPPSVTRAAPDEPSLYAIDVGIVDDRGANVKLDIGRGHPTLISMFYGSCAVACPALIGELKQVAALSPPETRIVLVSFDAARDTPAHLRELMTTYKLDERWTLAAANDTDARALAAVLGIKYRRTASGEFFHTSVIVGVDEDGRPVARMTGLGDPAPLVTAMAR